MYIDYLKQDYSDKPEEKRQKYIDRDKNHLATVIQERIANDIKNIVDRWYELNDVGYIPNNEKFLYLLKEAEQLYAFSYYTGTISIIGIASEEYCRFLIKENNITDVNTQYDRIEKLFESHVISSELQSAFHEIRTIRNNCMHYNTDFKNLSDEQLKTYAYQMIQSFKVCLQLISSINVSPDEITENMLSSEIPTFRDFIYRNRNIYKKEVGLDLQIDPDIKQLVFTSVYYIAEIDIDTDRFKEMTLSDTERDGKPLVVDLTLCQAERIREMKLQQGNLIIATVLSHISTIGQTEEWLLLDIQDIYRDVISLEDLPVVVEYMKNYSTEKV